MGGNDKYDKGIDMVNPDTSLSRSLTEAANLISNPMVIQEKASRQELEWLSDLGDKQIHDIRKLLKGQNHGTELWKYLVANKLMNSHGDVIGPYRLDRDIVSILVRSFHEVH